MKRKDSIKRNYVKYLIVAAIFIIGAIFIFARISYIKNTAPAQMRSVLQSVKYTYYDEEFSCYDMYYQKVSTNGNEFTPEYHYFFTYDGLYDENIVSSIPLGYENGKIYTASVIKWECDLSCYCRGDISVKYDNLKKMAEDDFVLYVKESVMETISSYSEDYVKSVSQSLIVFYVSALIITIVVLLVMYVGKRKLSKKKCSSDEDDKTDGECEEFLKSIVHNAVRIQMNKNIDIIEQLGTDNEELRNLGIIDVDNNFDCDLPF